MSSHSPSTVNISFFSLPWSGLTSIPFRWQQTEVSPALGVSEFVQVLLPPSSGLPVSILVSISISAVIFTSMWIANHSHFSRIFNPSCVTLSWSYFGNFGLPFIIPLVSEYRRNHFSASIQGLFLCFDIEISRVGLKPMDKDSEWTSSHLL